ncbi:hypothetical protein SAMN05660464_0649 [Geodermatophilus dictyosporus]|uniref:Uncharacterized protein n=1 Tax=Geodermatophilus dictyosporus TaxID=1523247 RepID=A0A1I5JCR9_9ACTN|nr:hypothetical protein [Geodermatophilus dictyosporus]SFO70577.1 hypothetical protein SAMN05660464_0649 [Geodermatophilus dictyosporus]
MSALLRQRAVRCAASVMGASGVALLARPRQVVGLVAPDEAEPWLAVVRLLGGRLVVQHALVALRPSRRRVVGGVVVDAVHALSMVPAAALWPGHRRLATVSGAVGAVSAALGLALAPPRP